jgi:hypothetical protein
MFPPSKDGSCERKVNIFTGERKPEERISLEAKYLKSIKRYVLVLTIVSSCLIGTIIAVIGFMAVKLQSYDIVQAKTLNALTQNALSITENAARMTTLAVPITSNLQFLSNAATAAVYSAVNATDVAHEATAARSSAGSAVSRRALQALRMDQAVVDAGVVPATTISADDLIEEDYRLREMMYKSTRKLMQTLNTKADEFNPAAVSDFLEFLVAKVNYTGIAQRFDRVVTDVERTAHFGVLASAMVGLASQATNVSLPSAQNLFDAYAQQKAAANSAAGGHCS